MKPKIGDYVYLDDCSRALYVGNMQDRFLVRQSVLFEDEYSAYDSEQIQEVQHIHSTPPIQIYEEQYLRTKDRIDEANSSLRDIITTVKQYESEQAEILKKAELNQAVKYVFDFLDGKITHFVYKDYSGVKIKSFDEALAEGGSSWTRQHKLLSLSLGTDKNIGWKVNQYRDGSGSDTPVIPCRSEQEARDVAKDILNDQSTKVLSDIVSNPSTNYTDRVRYIITSAKDIGIEPAKALSKMHHKLQLEKVRKEIGSLEKQLETKNKELAVVKETK